IDKITSISCQLWMRFFLDQDDKVTINTSSASRITLTGNRQLHTVLNTGRYLNSNDFLLTNQPFTITVRTGLSNYSSLTVTGRTGGCLVHLTQDSICNTSYLACSTAGGTGAVCSTSGSTCTVTMSTADVFLYFYLLFYTFSNLSKCQTHLYTQV